MPVRRQTTPETGKERHRISDRHERPTEESRRIIRNVPFLMKKSGREQTSVSQGLPAGYRRIQQRCQKGLYQETQIQGMKTQAV